MAKAKKFGTFGGVFVPSVLTILGVIMYMRLPMIVGSAGIWMTLGIIVVAHIISITTGLSIASMSTDKKVEAGGPYYIISRTLGLPLGGTLGLALFVGLSFSISLYLIGFSESLLPFIGFPKDLVNIRIAGSIALLILTIITFISTSLAIRAQYFILVAIALSIFSILWGNQTFLSDPQMFTNSSRPFSLMELFGIFFPAVTGFSAGVSMSGDLKDPKKSIPQGTIAAIAVGFIIYVGLAFFFALNINADALIGDPEILLNISWRPELVVAGIWGATLSSALGSILGAPRILQAISVDKISAKIFAKGYGPSNEPRNAVLLAFLIAEVGILIGELDVIARIVSIFFITTYGFLNISAAFEKWTNSDYRPIFKISGWVSLLGAVACLVVMIQLDFVAMLGAVFILGLIYFLLKRRELTLESGDAWSGVWASLVKTGLTKLMMDKLNKRTWRPNVIMFSGNPTNRIHMLDMGKAIVGKLGMLSAFELVQSDDKILAKAESNLEKGKDAVGYFKHKLHTRDIYYGMDQIARVYGFSGIEPNTVLMGWSKKPTNQEKFLSLVESFCQEKFNTIFLNYDHERGYGDYKTIDIWWSGSGRNLALAINLVNHITISTLWRHAKVRLLIINNIDIEAENIYKKTFLILQRFRLAADIKIINNEVERNNSQDIMETESRNANLVIVGVPDKKFRDFGNHFDKINDIVSRLGSSLVINASSDFEELEVVTQVKPKAKNDQVAEVKWVELPELKASKFEEITLEIQRIDNQDREVLDQFYSQTFESVFSDHQELLSKLEERVSSVQKELAKIENIPELFKRKKAIVKLKNELFFKLKAFVVEELVENQFVEQKEKLEGGIDRYLQQLNSNLDSFPSTFTIQHDDSDYQSKENDGFILGNQKRWKRWKHYILGQPFIQKIDYNSVTRYYHWQAKVIFTDKLLISFLEDEHIFYKNVRQITSSLVNALNEVEKRIWNEENKWQDIPLHALEKEIATAKTEWVKKSRYYHNHLALEFRSNLITMGNDMEDMKVRRLIAEKNQRKAALIAEVNIRNFPENFSLIVSALANIISLELSVSNTKNRQELVFDEFCHNLRLTLTTNYLRKIEAVLKKLELIQPIDFNKLKFQFDFEIELQELFDYNQNKMLLLADELPDSIEIYSLFETNNLSEAEPITIPVSRMGEYYLKSKYDSPIEERFENLLETIKRSLFSTQEVINLTHFNLENVESIELSEKEIIESFKLRLEKELSDLQQCVDNFVLDGESYLEDVYKPLASVRIQESAADFVVGLRNFKSLKMMSKFAFGLDKANLTFQKVVARLLYTRSETILFAKKMDKKPIPLSINSMLLDLKEKLSPERKGIQNLPPYYQALFNGKSNINKDYWVPRPKEEVLFKRAFKRQRAGYFGGILLLGERNSGKTTFARFVTQNTLKCSNVYAVFPPIPGNSSEDGFNQALAKATQKAGKTEFIISQLPQHSVLIINDLELFWERSERGMEVVKKIEKLIDQFGDKILFVVNMNPHAFVLINQLTKLDEHFIEIIRMNPFDALELTKLVMNRHKSSGLKFGFDAQKGQLNELKIASLFNNFFNYSKGNPGVTLTGWQANIVEFNGSFLSIREPDLPSLEVFDKMREDWVMMILQFILHKRLTNEKIENITGWNHSQTKENTQAMLRSGLIIEKASGVYHLDTIMLPFILSAMKNKEVLNE